MNIPIVITVNEAIKIIGRYGTSGGGFTISLDIVKFWVVVGVVVIDEVDDWVSEVDDKADVSASVKLLGFNN